MTELSERLFDEVDRQLEDVREQARTVATRAVLLLSAAVVGAPVMANGLNQAPRNFGWVFVPVVVSLMSAIVAFAPQMAIGPNPQSLLDWSSRAPASSRADLYASKILTLEANRRRLVIVTAAFHGEIVSLLVAATLVLVLSMAQ